MEKIIDGKIYNTNTNERIGGNFQDWISNKDIYKYFDTNIYLTDDNQFLLHIEEGFVCDNNQSNGNLSLKYEDLKLLNNKEMDKWLKENNSIFENDKIYSLSNTI